MGFTLDNLGLQGNKQRNIMAMGVDETWLRSKYPSMIRTSTNNRKQKEYLDAGEHIF
jgi:hypothetical protein